MCANNHNFSPAPNFIILPFFNHLLTIVSKPNLVIFKNELLW